MSEAVLKVENLTKNFYGKRKYLVMPSKEVPYTAVHHLSFQLHEGEILGILGPNGAGKTTLIEMLLGMLSPTSGNIYYFGKDFYKSRSEIIRYVSHASAYHKLPSSLTIQENLEIIGGLYGIPKPLLRKKIKELLERFEMIEFRNRATGKLSAGQMTRVLLAKAFLMEPKVILLDEPTASLDPDIAAEVRSFILQQQREMKIAMILTSHNMKEVAEICDRALVMRKGSIIREDTPEGLARSVALATVLLNFTKNRDKAIKIIEKNGWHSVLVDGHLKVEIDQADVPQFLNSLAKEDVEYSHIEITKPSLEDYFMTLTEGK
jgi:ABC-2 type transport system ATP-binding protein